MQKYVIVYVYDYDNYFLMIRKNKPAWQKGRLNLPGGKVEPNESYRDAAIREIKEESDIDLNPENLRFRGIISGNGYKIPIFSCYHYYLFDDAKPMTDEEVYLTNKDIISIDEMSTIYNLKLIIPLLREYNGLFVVDGDSTLFQVVRFYD